MGLTGSITTGFGADGVGVTTTGLGGVEIDLGAGGLTVGVAEYPWHITIEEYSTLLFRQPSLQITLPSESFPEPQLTPPWPEQAPLVAKTEMGSNASKLNINPNFFIPYIVSKIAKLSYVVSVHILDI